MDNNSNDGSDIVAKEEINNIQNSKYIKLSRNFGYQANIKAGYDNLHRFDKDKNLNKYYQTIVRLLNNEKN